MSDWFGMALAALGRCLGRESEYATALDRSERRFKDLVAATADWFWETDAEFRLSDLIVGGLSRNPVDTDILIGRTFQEVATGEDIASNPGKWRKLRDDVAARKSFRDFTFKLGRRDGGVSHIRASGIPVGGANGAFLGYRGTCTDVTQEAEARTQAADAQFYLLDAIEAGTDAFALFGRDDRLILCNGRYQALFADKASLIEPGVGYETTVRLDAELRCAKGLIRDAEAHVRDAMARHLKAQSTTAAQLADGRWFMMNECRTHNGGTVLVCTDISDVKARERLLEASEARLRNLSANLPGYLWQRELQPDGTIRMPYLGEGVRRILGYEPDEILAMPGGLFDLVVREDRENVVGSIKDAAANLRTWQQDFRMTCRSGEVKWIRSVAKPRRLDEGGIVMDGLTVDITEEVRRGEEHKTIETRLRQSQKMESLGTLAGGAAHEFNNLLVPIMMMTELAMSEIDEGGQAYKHLVRVVDNAERASKIINQILSFSRSNDVVRLAIDLAASVRDAADLLRATLPATIRLNLELPDSPCMVVADDTQLHQVLMNLASNAKHAIGESKIGEISIRLAVTDFDPALAARFPNAKPGRCARISVRDSGSGMDAKTMARIFEPFFTTKPVGQGTGLGLAVIHGIVSGHGGAIDVKSEVGKGTTFDVYLPLADGAGAAGDAAEAEGEAAPSLAANE